LPLARDVECPALETSYRYMAGLCRDRDRRWAARGTHKLSDSEQSTGESAQHAGGRKRAREVPNFQAPQFRAAVAAVMATPTRRDER
jgi:hypothetical protein